MLAFSNYLCCTLNFCQEYAGKIDLIKSSQGTASDISHGSPLLLRVTYPTHNPVPKIKDLYYNNQHLCSSPSGK